MNKILNLWKNLVGKVKLARCRFGFYFDRPVSTVTRIRIRIKIKKTCELTKYVLKPLNPLLFDNLVNILYFWKIFKSIPAAVCVNLKTPGRESSPQIKYTEMYYAQFTINPITLQIAMCIKVSKYRLDLGKRVCH